MFRSRLVHAVTAVTAAVSAVALATAGLAVTAAPADGALTLRPRTYTAVLTPTTAPAGAATTYSVKVTNTSTVISALDRFVLSVPSGFTVTTGAVTAPRGGWTESLVPATATAPAQLAARTSQPILKGLRKGEAMTVAFTATSPACVSQTATWGQKADGLIVDPFLAQSPDPTVALTAYADRFEVTSVTDASDPPLQGAAGVNAQFAVSGRFLCGTASAPTRAASTVSLSKATAGTPDTSGALAGTLSTSLPAGSTTATVSGATYGAVENDVGIAATWSGGTGDSFLLDVFGEVQTVIGEPFQPIPPAELTVGGAQADLYRGANGPVSLVVSACEPDPPVTAPCRAGTEVELTASLKDDAGLPLYSFAKPARISWLCDVQDCPHGANGSTEGEPSSNYLYNYHCPGTSCAEGGQLFKEREVEEDFTWYPVYVSLRRPDGTETQFAQAPRCVPLPSSNNASNRYELLHTTGKITNPAAKTLGFCVDVNAITRDGNVFGGALRLPVLFVEDLKLRP